jgi:hypothetical protein
MRLALLVLFCIRTNEGRADESSTPSPLALAVRGEIATGKEGGGFVNRLLGVGLGYEFAPAVHLTAQLHVNLKGKDGRDHALMPTVQGEYRLAVDWGVVKSVPLRFASGYLPRNGPVVRASAGLLFPLSSKVDLVAELLSPMVWVTNDQTLFSMNVALELVIGMGP